MQVVRPTDATTSRFFHRAGKSPQEITQQTGYKKNGKKSGGVAFDMYGFDVVKLS